MAYNAIRFTSPKGEAEYPYLNEPDTKFNPDGDYKVNMIFEDDKATRDMISKLEKVLDDFYENDETVKSARKPPVKNEIYEELDDGRLLMKFKQKAIIRTKAGKEFEKKVRIFDAKGKPMDDAIGGGSILKVCFEASPYYIPSTRMVGLSLKPVAVQVIELKTFGGADNAESYGFGEEEGFVSEAESDSYGFDAPETIDELVEDNPDF